ncbi:hypothetical protein DLREEDagrD3_25970 [Denitratisoma sp. agr-D3]
MKRQKGFGAIVAIVLLVLLASISVAIVALGATQQTTLAQDVLSARAWQAARAGNEWGLYYALNNQNWAGANTSCATASQSKTLNLTTETGMYVTVTCDSWLYNEGEDTPGSAKTVRIYRIVAVACPATSCPASDASVSRIGYVERRRMVIATGS